LWLRLEQNVGEDGPGLLRSLERRFSVCPRRPSCTQFGCSMGSRVHLPFLDIARENRERITGQSTRAILLAAMVPASARGSSSPLKLRDRERERRRRRRDCSRGSARSPRRQQRSVSPTRHDPSRRRKRRKSSTAEPRNDSKPFREKEFRKDTERRRRAETRKEKEPCEGKEARKDNEARKVTASRKHADSRKEKDLRGEKELRDDKESRKDHGRRHGCRHRERSRRRHRTSLELASRSRSPMVRATSEAPCKPEKLDEAKQKQHKSDSVEDRLKRCLELTAEKDIEPSDNQAMDEKLRHYIERLAAEDEQYSFSDSRDSNIEDDPVRRYSDEHFAKRVNAAIGRQSPDTCEPDLGRRSSDSCEPALRRWSPDFCETEANRKGKSDQSRNIDGLHHRLQALLGSIM